MITNSIQITNFFKNAPKTLEEFKKTKYYVWRYEFDENMKVILRFDNEEVLYNLTTSKIEKVTPLPFRHLGKAERAALTTLNFRLQSAFYERANVNYEAIIENSPIDASFLEKYENEYNVYYFYRNVLLYKISYNISKKIDIDFYYDLF